MSGAIPAATGLRHSPIEAGGWYPPAEEPPRTPDMNDNINTDAFSKLERLKALRVAHRDLDTAIATLSQHAEVDQLHVRRLKKEKLRLKDMIARLESALIPDLNA